MERLQLLRRVVDQQAKLHQCAQRTQDPATRAKIAEVISKLQHYQTMLTPRQNFLITDPTSLSDYRVAVHKYKQSLTGKDQVSAEEASLMDLSRRFGVNPSTGSRVAAYDQSMLDKEETQAALAHVSGTAWANQKALKDHIDNRYSMWSEGKRNALFQQAKSQFQLS